MKLKDFDHNPSGIVNKYPFYPELMEKHIKVTRNEKGVAPIMDFIEGKSPRIFDGYDQIKVRPAHGSLRSKRKSHDLVERKAFFGTVTVIDRIGYEESNRMHEEKLIRAVFRHLVINVFHIPFNEEDQHFLDDIPFNMVKEYVGRYFPVNPLWMASTVSVSSNWRHHDIERTPELSLATSVFSSIRRQNNLTDTATKQPINLKKGYVERAHKPNEPDELFQLYCYEGKDFKTQDDKRHPYRPFPIFKDSRYTTKEEMAKSVRTDDPSTFLDRDKCEVRIGYQSII